MCRGENYIQAGRKRIQAHERYDLRMSELLYFVDMAYKKSIDAAIGNAFRMGFEAGARMTERQAKYGKS